MKEPPTHPADQVDELIAMIAHDLRSPITAVKGFSQLALRQSDVPPRIRDYVAVTIKETNRMATLIDDLVLASQVPRQRPVHIERVAVSEIFELAIQRSRRLDATTDVVIENAELDLVSDCDPALTTRAVTLLIRTAQRYCVRSTTITLRAHDVDGRVIIGVLPDSNVGSEKLRALRRVVGAANDAPNDELSPSGLGLYICRRLIEVQDGRVWIDQPPEWSHAVYDYASGTNVRSRNIAERRSPPVELTQDASAQMGMKVSPRLVAASYILELSSQELQQAIAQEISENPAMELIEKETCPACGGPMQGSICPACLSQQKSTPTGTENEYDSSDDYINDLNLSAPAPEDDFDPFTRLPPK